MTNMKKMLLSSAILATTPVMATEEVVNGAGIENNGEWNINNNFKLTSADGKWLENYGTINLSAGKTLTLASQEGAESDSGININLARGFMNMTNMQPTVLINNKDSELLKDYAVMLAQMQYYRVADEGGKFKIAGAEVNDSETLNNHLYDATTNPYGVIILSDANSKIKFDTETENGEMYPFLKKDGKNVTTNLAILRSKNAGEEIKLDNTDNDEETLEVNIGIANNGTYLNKFTSSQTGAEEELKETQDLNVRGKFNFKGVNWYFSDGKVSFTDGTSTISSVASMFQSNIDVKNNANLILNPQCLFYSGDNMVNEDKKTITYNSEMNVSGNGKLTVSAGKLIIGRDGKLNLGASA